MLKPLILCLCVIFCVSINLSHAQYQRCAAHEHHLQKLEKDPSFRENRRINEAKLQAFLSNPNNRRTTVVTIPIVFQVFHNGDTIGSNENLSVAQLQAGIDQLNDDYSRNNSDASNTPQAFQGLAADTQIQFCLATEDPNGNSTSGVNRYNISTISNINQNACWVQII